ncbi:TIGR03086 family metal-binding protein [Actinomycetospora sp. OC33-EN08]|uniref:TIGR03086 family metal-binding protein n=1 Tax=Actinomycetospora aurantiaca TaxID=3129233 RepID=A0ABU8MIQ0_9PSEU
MSAPDPRPLLTRALDQIGDLVAATGPDALARPTPCADWDVRALLDHLVGVHRRVAHVGAGGHFADVDPNLSVPVGAHADEVARARAEVDRVWGLDGADDSVLDRELTVPWGAMPGRFAAFGYVQELTVHAWDLAVATGRTEGLDPVLAEAVEETARRVLPAEPRGGPIPFGPPVATTDDAGPYARLVGWLGREPSFTAPERVS